MFFLDDSHHFYILSSEINLCKNPHLQLLQFNFSLWTEMNGDLQDDMIRWINSICESVTSRSLVVELCGLSNESEICHRIEDILLSLHTRIETLSMFISTKCFSGQKVDLEDVRKLFSRLYEVGIVVEKWLGWNGNEVVSGYFLTSNLPILTMLMLSVSLLSVGSFAVQSTSLFVYHNHLHGQYHNQVYCII